LIALILSYATGLGCIRFGASVAGALAGKAFSNAATLRVCSFLLEPRSTMEIPALRTRIDVMSEAFGIAPPEPGQMSNLQITRSELTPALMGDPFPFRT
jgi:hypothetical protein